MTDPIKFHLVRDGKPGDPQADLKKIIDYLITFVGEVSVKRESPSLVTISYANTPLQATLKTVGGAAKKGEVVVQMTLTCEREDNLSVNLLKNVTKNIGYRIFNPQNNSFLVVEPQLMDLTTVMVEPLIARVFDDYHLTPLFKHRNALVFFAEDRKGGIHLVNRHLLEHLTEDEKSAKGGSASGGKKILQKDFSIEVAPDIGRFVALFDRGLIPRSFYESYHNPTKLINWSGFDVNGFERSVFIESVFFVLDAPSQSFRQLSLTKKDLVPKGEKLKDYLKKALKESKFKNELMAAKVARDIHYNSDKGGKLVPRLTLSVFLDATG
jgi:hypothetical protein